MPQPGESATGEFVTKSAVVRVLWITLALNLIIAIAKIVIGYMRHNLTVVADGFHGLTDASNNVLGLAGVIYSYRPPDENHPYGHRKIEALCALAIGAIMALVSWEILKSIFVRLFLKVESPPHPFAWFPAGILAATLVANFGISTYELAQGKKHKSAFLLADALHTRSDIFVTLMSIASMAFASGRPWIDGLLSLVVVAFIMKAGWTIVRDNTLILTDATRLDPEPVRRVAESVPGVENCHAIRSHGMPDDIHLDLHIVVGPDLTAAQTHEIEDAVRVALFHEFPQVTEVSIHHQTEPPVTAKPVSRANVLEEEARASER